MYLKLNYTVKSVVYSKLNNKPYWVGEREVYLKLNYKPDWGAVVMGNTYSLADSEMKNEKGTNHMRIVKKPRIYMCCHGYWYCIIIAEQWIY